MPKPTPLARLREIRDIKSRADALTAERDELIRKAVLEEERSHRSVAMAAGLAPSHVSRIVHSN
jgi:DNA-directed RNA polymerase specialized sigma subunit